MILLTYSLLMGCSGAPEESKLAKESDGSEACVPDIELSPAEILFGEVSSDAPKTVNVTVSNVGCSTLELFALSLEDSEAPFELSAIGSVLIAPRQSTSFTVTFDPYVGGIYSTQAFLQSNDPDEEFSSVYLEGTGLTPTLEVSPLVHDFGGTPIGCIAELSLVLKNTGAIDLIITALDYTASSSELSLNDSPALPLTLAPNTSESLHIRYQPTDELADSSSLLILSNNPEDRSIKATQAGTGVSVGSCN